MRHLEQTEALLARLAIGPGWVRPSYDGWGIANLMPTILDLFGLATPWPRLDAAALPPELTRGVRLVACLIIDALGYRQLVAELARQPDLTLAALTARPEVAFAPLTSVFPSTTTSALPTLYSGAPPAAHGGLGYSLFLPQFGGVTEMIRFGPAAGTGSYCDAGVDPLRFLQVPPVWAGLAEAGIGADFLNYAPYARSALTRMLGAGATFHPYRRLSDLGVRLRELIERTAPERALIVAYYGAVDDICHAHGALTPRHAAEVAAIDWVLRREVFDRVRRPDTLFLLVADHGHTNCPAEAGETLSDRPEVLALTAAVAGEARARYLHARSGAEARLRDAVLSIYGDRCTVLTRDEAFAAGLFGPPETPPPTDVAGRPVRERVGDLVLLPHGQRFLLHGVPEPATLTSGEAPSAGRWLIGRHGGLTPEEMLVPLIACRLG